MVTLGLLDTAGERLAVECGVPWTARLVAESADGQLDIATARVATILIRIEASRHPFDTTGWELVTRGAWRHAGEVVLENPCTAGFDLHLDHAAPRPRFTFRWRPPLRDRGAARVLRSRFHLLARAVLIQYPALWWAGTRGRVPLHASACVAGEGIPLLSAAGGVGRSTLLLEELARGGIATGDNISVGDGTTTWGLVEPLRVTGGAGRRMPHGRCETAMHGRVAALAPDRLVVLERGAGRGPVLEPIHPGSAARSLVASTYMAGELRRYWSFAATLAAATGIGPAHPPIARVARAFAAALPCYRLVIGRTAGQRLSDFMGLRDEVAACA